MEDKVELPFIRTAVLNFNKGSNDAEMKKRLVLSMITHPVFILVYWIAFYELYTLCQFGRINNNIIILSGCMLFFLIWFIILIIRIIKKPADEPDHVMDEPKSYKIVWTCTAIIVIILTTAFYGAKIYHSAVNYNGKLSWFLNDLKNKRTVKLEHSNIYESGIEGIFTDISKKISMPEKLYVATSFSLNFDTNGTITSFDTFVYGKNEKGKLKSYLISYNRNKSGNITIYLNGYAKADYNEDKLIKPLISTMKVIPLKKTVSSWNEKQYGILYYGKRSWGYNTNGIIYINSKGDTKTAVDAASEIIGYTVSVFVPGKENKYTPARYILAEDLENIKADSLNSDKDENIYDQSGMDKEVFYLSKKTGYRLEITGAACGSRSYSLNGTSDGGTTWKVINEDPFNGMVGTAAGITFINDKLGFLCLSHNGGNNGELYRTEDGGLTYKKVDFPERKVTLSGGGTYNPFDLPGMPYEKEGSLDILVGQGSDGDYNGGCKALYQSKDQGKTWNYIKEAAAD